MNRAAFVGSPVFRRKTKTPLKWELRTDGGTPVTGRRYSFSLFTLFALFGLFVFFAAAAEDIAAAEQVTTTPLQFYGLGTLNCAAWSPDGTRIVTGGSMGAFLWDAATSRVIRMFVGHSAEVVALAISPNGSLVLTGSADGTARLWSVNDGATLRVFSDYNGQPNSVAFSPDGTRVLIALNDHTARLYNVSDGAQVAMFFGHSDDVLCAAFSADGSRVATGSEDHRVKIWSPTGAPIRTIICYNRVTNLVFSPDGTKILTATEGEKTLYLWNTADGSTLGTITWGSEYGTVTCFTFSRDGQRIFIGTLDGFAFVRPTVGGADMGFFIVGNAPVKSITFSPDGSRLLTAIGAPDNAPRIWDANHLPYHVVISGHTARINSVAFSSDGTKALIGSGYIAKMRNVSDGSEVRTFSPAPTDPAQTEVISVAISPDGTKVLTGHTWPSSVVKLWNAVDGTLIRTFYGAGSDASHVAFSRDGMRIFADDIGGANLWDASNGTLIRRFSGHSGWVRSGALSPDGTKVLTGSEDATAKLWNVADGTLIRTFGNGGNVLSVSFSPSPDGVKVLTGSTDRTAKVWDASSGTLLLTLSGHTDALDSAAFSSDGTMILTGSWDQTAKLWDATSGTLLRTFSGHASSLLDAVFSPDGTKVLTASGDTTARLYTTSDSTCIRTFSGHIGPISSAAFSPDGNELLTGSMWASTAHLWNASSGTLIRTFISSGGNTNWASFSRDGNKVLTGTYGTIVEDYNNGRASLWSRSSGDLIWKHWGAGPVAYSPTGSFVARVAISSTIEILDGSSGTLINSWSGSWPYSVAFSPEGTRIVTGSASFDEVRIWDVPDGNLIRTFSVTSFGASSVAFSPDGTRVLAGGYGDPTARLWNALDGTLIRTITPGNPVTEAIGSVAFSPDGTKALLGTCSVYQGLTPGQASGSLWDLSNGSLIRRFQRHTRTVSSVAFSQDGSKMVTASYDGTARIWNMPGAAPSLLGHNRAAIAVAGSADLARVATLHKDNQANVWGGVDGALFRTFSGRMAQIRCVALASSGTLFVTGEDTVAKLWDLGSSLPIRLFEGHVGAINAVVLSRDTTRLLTTSDDGMAVLWNTGTGAATQLFYGWDARVYAGALSADGGLVATGGSSSTAHVWNAVTGQHYRTFSGHTSAVLCVAISNDGSTLLTGSADKTAKLWNAINGALLHTFTGYTSPVVSVAFSPDGSSLLTAGGTTVKFWNAADGTLLKTIAHAPGQWITGAVASQDGTRVVTGSEDGIARLWPGFGVGGGGSGGGGGTGPVLNGDKFLLVSGGGDYVGNPILNQTKALADRALFTAQVRGYRRNEIRYLSAFNDWATRDSNGDGLPDADSQATTQTFWSAIDTWSSGTARLFILLVDHGSWNSVSNQWYFRLNQNDYINAHDLDAHLDTLQAATGCEVVLIVDCCYSGGFVQECAPTSGTKRIVIASTTATNLAVYTLPEGAESFTFIFLSYAILGNTLEDCFRWTQTAFLGMGNPAGQTPWMDDDGDGDSDKWDGVLAARYVLGRYPAFGLNAPTITAVETTRTVAVHEPVTLWARLGEAVAVKEVWALIVPLGRDYAPGEPVTDLVRLDLAYTTATGRWEAQWRPGHSHAGRCIVTYFAVSEDSLKTRLLATPLTSGLLVVGDSYEIDDAATSATEYIFSEVPEFPPEQLHNFHDAGDADWVKFYGHGGRPYTIRVENPGTSCDAVIELYDRPTTTSWIARADYRGPGQPEELPRTLPTTGTYYVKVYNANAAVFGEGTSYTLRLTCDTGAGIGLATALGSNRLLCSWTNGMQAGDRGHNLYRKTPEASNWTLVNGAPIPTNSFIDTNLQSSTQYNYMVTVVQGDGSETPPLGRFYGVTSATLTSPTLAAEPAFTSGTSNQAAWSPVTLAAAYWLEWADNGAFTSAQNSGWTSATQATATGLSDGATYYYRVKCRRALLDESAWSNVVSSRQDASAPQTAVGALATYQGTATFPIPWSGSDAVSGLASVRLFYRHGIAGIFTQYGGTFAASPISFNSTGTGGDGDYYFYTVGTDNVGNVESAPVAPDAQTTVLTTPSPTPVMAAEPAFTRGTSNSVTWSAVAGAAAYTCQRDTTVAFAAPTSSGWIAATQWTAGGLVSGTTYYYQAKSRNAALVESAWSNVVHSRQDAAPPTAPGRPTDAGAFTSSTSVRFNWTAAGDTISGVASYDLQVGTTPGGTNVFNANGGNVLTRTVTGANGQPFYGRVRARDAVGNIGPWSLNSNGITIDTTKPRLTAATAGDNVSVDITFSEPVVQANITSNYTCTGGLQILQASQSSAAQYRLYTSAQSPGTQYTVQAGGSLRDRAGNALDPAAASRKFTGGAKTGALRWQLYP